MQKDNDACAYPSNRGSIRPVISASLSPASGMNRDAMETTSRFPALTYITLPPSPIAAYTGAPGSSIHHR